MLRGKRCFRCGTTQNLHRHHIYEGWGNRRISEENGFVIFLCGKHHNLSNEGIHFDKAFDLEVKKMCQAEYEKTHSREEFMKLIGRNYLDEEESDIQRDGDSAEEWICGIGF